jgi:oxygen-dependent protoporphyrinogen oxidase
MRSQLPEHALATLLRQCFITPRCQASRICRRKLLPSFGRELHTSRAFQFLPRRRPSTLDKQRRLYQTSSRCANNETLPVRHTSSSGFDWEAGKAYQLQLNIAEQHNKQQSAGAQERNRPQDSTRIAVLGGGITGLASAHYLARELPHAKITLYEGSDRLGGWLRSKHINVGNGTVIFEQGPRTLRPSTPAGFVMLDMVRYSSCIFWIDAKFL